MEGCVTINKATRKDSADEAAPDDCGRARVDGGRTGCHCRRVWTGWGRPPQGQGQGRPQWDGTEVVALTAEALIMADQVAAVAGNAVAWRGCQSNAHHGG